MRIHAERHRRMGSVRAVILALVLLGAAGCTPDSAGSLTDVIADDETSGQPPESTGQEKPTLDGATFTDPEGHYTLVVPTEWEARHGVAGEGVEVWLVGEPDATFTPNVNVMTEDVVGMSLSDYLALSISNAPNVITDFELLSSDLITGAGGQELAVMESTGLGLQFLGVMGMGPDGPVIVTLSVPPDRFAAIKESAYPYMLTLELSAAT